MPNWSRNVPDSPRGPALPIRRTPPGKPLQAIVTSEDLLGCYTHYWHGSTCPCEGSHCEPCGEGLPFRWHSYLTAIDSFSNLHFIFEVTALGATAFIEYREHNSTIRGCLFQARRWNNRANGRILIQTKTADLTTLALPKAPDLRKCMAILWNLPADDVAAEHTNPDKQMRELKTAIQRKKAK